MTIIMQGAPQAQAMKDELITYIKDRGYHDSYVAILLLGNNRSSQVYVAMKKKWGESCGINVQVWSESENLDDVLEIITSYNADSRCLGIVVQLPLPEHLQPYKSQILQTIKPEKDIDGLGGVLFGLASIDAKDFLPATPYAVMSLLQYYGYDEMKGKIVTVIGQSNLVGKPLVMDLIRRGAEVISLNENAGEELLVRCCQQSDLIISATGVAHLIDEHHVRNDQSQVLVDVGYAMIDGKSVGDINFDAVKDLVKAISPVPGGVGPLTVACLFDNIRRVR